MNRLLQALIALSGLAITGLLTWQGLENERAQTRLAQLALFSEQVGVAVSICSPTTLVMATDAANELARRNKNDEKYLDYLAQVSSEVDECTRTRGETPPEQARDGEQRPQSGGASPDAPPPAAAEAPQASQTVDLRQQEGLGAPDAVGAGPAQRWYAVVASYRPGEEQVAAGHVADLLRQVQAMSPPVRVEVYRTRVSNYFAIVLTPEGATRQGARALVSRARELGWSRDAFVQDDRSWLRCDSPETAEGLRSNGARGEPPQAHNLVSADARRA